jgi:hypothetical protein
MIFDGMSRTGCRRARAPRRMVVGGCAPATVDVGVGRVLLPLSWLTSTSTPLGGDRRAQDLRVLRDRTCNGCNGRSASIATLDATRQGGNPVGGRWSSSSRWAALPAGARPSSGVSAGGANGGKGEDATQNKTKPPGRESGSGGGARDDKQRKGGGQQGGVHIENLYNQGRPDDGQKVANDINRGVSSAGAGMGWGG